MFLLLVGAVATPFHQLSCIPPALSVPKMTALGHPQFTFHAEKILPGVFLYTLTLLLDNPSPWPDCSWALIHPASAPRNILPTLNPPKHASSPTSEMLKLLQWPHVPMKLWENPWSEFHMEENIHKKAANLFFTVLPLNCRAFVQGCCCPTFFFLHAIFTGTQWTLFNKQQICDITTVELLLRKGSPFIQKAFYMQH